MECIVQAPSGEYAWSDAFALRVGPPYGVMVTAFKGLEQPGKHRVRWYATEHRGRLHEVARMTWVPSEPIGKP